METPLTPSHNQLQIVNNKAGLFVIEFCFMKELYFNKHENSSHSNLVLVYWVGPNPRTQCCPPHTCIQSMVSHPWWTGLSRIPERVALYPCRADATMPEGAWGGTRVDSPHENGC